jgi:hypothetical protein
MKGYMLCPAVRKINFFPELLALYCLLFLSFLYFFAFPYSSALVFRCFLFIYALLCVNIGSRVSSVSTVSDYGLDDRAIGVRSPAGAKDFSSTGGPFPGGKARPGSDADHSPPLVPRSWMSRSYTSSPPSASMACSGTALLLFTYWLSILMYHLGHEQ